MKVGRRINHDIAHSQIDFLIISHAQLLVFCLSYIHLHLTYWHIRERTIAIEWKKKVVKVEEEEEERNYSQGTRRFFSDER